MDRKRILVIDDEVDFLKIIKMNLEATNRYEVLISESAANIISLTHGFKPDLIILDNLMPVINGMRACDMLHEDEAICDTPIIICSALDKLESKLKASKKGAIKYIIKPASKDEVISKIEEVLGC